jgi:acyl-CoA synthetase (AMP-forming)/AMP-acid ligase II
VHQPAGQGPLWPFLADTPPVIVDWLPWSHTFGGNHNVNLVLRHGGTLYIDGGRPVPGLFETSIGNLKDQPPTLYFNVPRGFELLVAALRQDAHLRDAVFSRLQVAFYAAAALPQHLWDALNEMAIATLGQPVALVSASWGSTETVAAGDRLPLPGAALRRDRRAGPRHRTEAGAQWRQARDPGARPQHHAGLLAQPGAVRQSPSTTKAST